MRATSIAPARVQRLPRWCGHEVIAPLQAACAALLAFPPACRCANAQDASGRDDRLSLMVAGHKLTNTDGGWGASAVWLHNFSANTLIGLGAETQTIKSDISDARWTFGRLSFNHGIGCGGDAHQPLSSMQRSARGTTTFTITTTRSCTAGMYQNLTRQLTLQLEDKQVNVDTARGNLPKLAVQYLWSPAACPHPSVAPYSVSGTARHAARDGAHRRTYPEDDESVCGPCERPGGARRGPDLPPVARRCRASSCISTTWASRRTVLACRPRRRCWITSGSVTRTTGR